MSDQTNDDMRDNISDDDMIDNISDDDLEKVTAASIPAFLVCFRSMLGTATFSRLVLILNRFGTGEAYEFTVRELRKRGLDPSMAEIIPH